MGTRLSSVLPMQAERASTRYADSAETAGVFPNACSFSTVIYIRSVSGVFLTTIRTSENEGTREGDAGASVAMLQFSMSPPAGRYFLSHISTRVRVREALSRTDVARAFHDTPVRRALRRQRREGNARTEEGSKQEGKGKEKTT